MEKGRRQPWLLSHTDREDNTYTLSVVVHHDGPKSPVYPIYAHTKRMPARRKNYPHPPSEESFEFNLDVGDALLFKGRHHIHWRNNMPEKLVNYWSILLHYVD